MKLKEVILMVGIGALVTLFSCQEPFNELITQDEQLAIDIEDIENYLSDKGYTDYDTLSSQIRALILAEGTGEPVEYEDVIRYEYIGRFISNDILFDTSYPLLAFTQDTTNADSLVFELDVDDGYVLDVNGLPSIEYASFAAGYFPIYRSLAKYEPLTTTHTPGGWFILQESNTVAGFNIGTHYVLDRVNLDGSGLFLLPSSTGGVQLGFGSTVISFEVIPVRKEITTE